MFIVPKIMKLRRQENLFNNKIRINWQEKIDQEFTKMLKEISTNYSRIMRVIWQKEVNLNQKITIFDRPYKNFFLLKRQQYLYIKHEKHDLA